DALLKWIKSEEVKMQQIYKDAGL
ncbi:MAG: hypothetical protein RLZZ579_1247, partial [Actinomycetota bacterium]